MGEFEMSEKIYLITKGDWQGYACQVLHFFKKTVVVEIYISNTETIEIALNYDENYLFKFHFNYSIKYNILF